LYRVIDTVAVMFFICKLAGTENFEPTVQEDRILLWKVTMKCADVNNPTKEWSLSGMVMYLTIKDPLIHER
jgi:hypothetical protein